jgi:hypothetical protein
MKFIIIILLFLCNACSSTQNKLTSINQIDDVANILMAINDDIPEFRNTCGLKSTEAALLLNTVHALKDEEAQKIKSREIEDKEEKLLSSCVSECHCGLYSDLTNNEILKNKFEDNRKLISKEIQKKCNTASAKWLCHSPIYLKIKESTELNPIGH